MMRCPRCGGDGAFRPDATWIGACAKCQGVLLVTLADTPSGGDQADAPLVAQPQAPGTVYLTEEFLARYELLHPIGEGATASVFLGRDRENDQKVAIKFLAHAGKRQVLTRFVREAKLLAGIHHPNVIRLLASGDIDGRPYLVSEFCEGGTLRGRMTGKRERTPENALSEPLKTPELGIRLQPKEAVRLIIAVLAGLEACHEAGIIHRDMKPENILITGAGEVRLADFGVAREEVSGEPSLTPMGAVIGTPRYMAPEQVRGDRATPATDLYATGAILFEMLAGRPPFMDDRTFELLRAQLDKAPPRLRAAFPELPVALEAIVQDALAKAPERRPDSAKAFAKRLEQCLRVLDGLEPDLAEAPVAPAARGASAATVQPPSRRPVWPMLVAGMAVMVLIGVAGRSGGPGGATTTPSVSAVDPEAMLAQRQRLDEAELAWTRGALPEARKLYEVALAAARVMPPRFQIAVLRSRIEREKGAGQRAEVEKLIMMARAVQGADPAEVRELEALGVIPGVRR